MAAGEEFTQLDSAANDIWREAAGLWLDRTADLRDYFLYSAATSCDARGGGADLRRGPAWPCPVVSVRESGCERNAEFLPGQHRGGAVVVSMPSLLIARAIWRFFKRLFRGEGICCQKATWGSLALAARAQARFPWLALAVPALARLAPRSRAIDGELAHGVHSMTLAANPESIRGGFDIPVALIVYNRPEFTRQIIAALRPACPRHILIIADGPNLERSGDDTRCQQVRAAVAEIDWPCEVELNAADNNLVIPPRGRFIYALV